MLTSRNRLYLIVGLAAAGGLFGVLVPTAPAVASVIITTGVMLLGLVVLTKVLLAHDRRLEAWTIRWVMAAFLFHVIAGILIWHDQRLVNYLGPDALTYHAGAIGILQHWQSGFPMPNNIAVGKSGYWYMLAGLYWAVGTHAEAGIVVNAGLGAAIIPIIVDATRRRFSDDAARVTAPLLLLIPGFALWSSQLLREPTVYLLIAVAMSASVRLSTRTSLSAILIFAASIGFLTTVRADVALLVAAGLVAGLAFGRRSGGFVTGAGMAAMVLAIVLVAGLGYAGFHLVTHSSFEQVNVVRNGSASASSGFSSGNIASPLRSLGYLPVGFLDIFLGPFPWQIHGARQLPAVPDVLVWWYLLPSLWRGVRSTYRRFRRGVVLDLLPALLVTMLLGLLIGNFGTVVRERMQVILLLVPLVAVGWVERHQRGRGRAGSGELTGELQLAKGTAPPVGRSVRGSRPVKTAQRAASNGHGGLQVASRRSDRGRYVQGRRVKYGGRYDAGP